MALIDIEYGSLASSEIMNKNFMYLDDKIADTSETIMTSISSILSNIATINTRLSDISDEFKASIEEVSSKLNEYKTKTKILVNKSTMIPNWAACEQVSVPVNTDYTVSENGYLLFKTTNTTGKLYVNGSELVLKTINSVYDSALMLSVLPVSEGDIVKTTVGFIEAYFLPTSEISIDNF